MANYQILTNNPLVLAKYPAVSTYEARTVRDVFIAMRDAVHRGAVLISHPLAGSIKPNESPVKSIMLSTRQGAVDERSFAVMEDALYVLNRMPDKGHTITDRMLADYRAIDLDLMDSAMAALPADYH